jgi:hypothetical protein
MKHYITAIILLAYVGCAAPDPNAATHQMEAQRAARQHAFPVTPEIQAARDKLIADYGALLSELFPDYNDIRVRFIGNVYGPEWGFLMAEHSMFTAYTFDVGPAGPAVKQWIAAHHAELEKARITMVGLGFNGPSYMTGIMPPQ